MHFDAPHQRFGAVTVLPGDRSGKFPDGNQVIVRGRDALAVFDTPLSSRGLSGAAGAAFDDADLAILGHVHEDHMAALPRLRRAAVHVHRGDIEAARSWDGLARHYGYPAPVLDELRVFVEREFDWRPRPDAIAYDDGATWDLGGGVRVRAVHLPGHTAGHCALLVEPDGVAFVGDIDLTGFGPYYGDATSSLADFRASLARVRELPARVWVTSHHRGTITDRAAFESALDAFAAKIDAREQRLLGMLSGEPRTLDALARERILYPPQAAGLWIEAAERRTIAQHLDELLAAGRIERVGTDGFRSVAGAR